MRIKPAYSYCLLFLGWDMGFYRKIHIEHDLGMGLQFREKNKRLPPQNMLTPFMLSIISFDGYYL